MSQIASLFHSYLGSEPIALSLLCPNIILAYMMA